MYFIVMFIFLITNEYVIVRRGVVICFNDVQRYGENKRNYYYYDYDQYVRCVKDRCHKGKQILIDVRPLAQKIFIHNFNVICYILCIR